MQKDLTNGPSHKAASDSIYTVTLCKMSADRGRISWQEYRSRPESVPLRDLSPGTSVLHEPSNSGSIVPEEEESHRDQTGRTTIRVTQSQPQGLAGEISLYEEKRFPEAGVAGELTKHTLALALVYIYALVAIPSWSITCVLSYRPMGVPSYFDQTGNYSRSHYETTDFWRKAASVGQSILGVISIPVTSAICTKAAAVYCQRNSDAKTPSLSLRQMLVLADKGWIDLATLLNVVRPSTSRRTRSPLLILSASLVAIGKGAPMEFVSRANTSAL